MTAREWMKNNISMTLLMSLLIIMGLCSFFVKKEAPAQIIVPKMDTVVVNDKKDWKLCCGQTGDPYPLSYIMIEKVSFATDKNDLFVRYDLGGKLPESGKILPSYDKDQLTGVVFYLDFATHYFNELGEKKSNSFDVNAKFSFYGKLEENQDDGRLNVDGKLVSGGPGFDHFVVRFPYRQLLFNQSGPAIVFGTSSIAVTKKYPSGASKFYFENKNLSANGINFEDIKINLVLKK